MAKGFHLPGRVGYHESFIDEVVRVTECASETKRIAVTANWRAAGRVTGGRHAAAVTPFHRKETANPYT